LTIVAVQKKDWEMIIGEFQNNVTDSVIECAIKNNPRKYLRLGAKK